MSIERFIWTDHAELRLSDRSLNRQEVEAAVRLDHRRREVNWGESLKP